jgi:SAM-dependent methyltransferase
MDDLVKPNVENSVSFHQRILVTFLRSFFKLLYHQLAWSYNGVAAIVSLGSWQTWILSTLPYLPGPRVLEIGFGRGNLQAALYPRVAWSVGIDESRQMVEFTHKKLRKAGYHPNLIRGDVFSLPRAGHHWRDWVHGSIVSPVKPLNSMRNPYIRLGITVSN